MAAGFLPVDPMNRVARIAARQDGMVTLDQARLAGLATHEVESYVRYGRWRRLARGAYLIVGGSEPTPRRARIRAVMASFGPGAVAVSGTAVELHGIAGLTPTEVVHVGLPGPQARAPRSTDPMVLVHQRKLPTTAITTVNGIRVTSPLWTVADTILAVDHFSAVSVMDSALNRGLLGDAELAAIPALLRGRRGAVAARRAIGRADARAQSPLETRVRLRCVDGRVPPDALQVPVRDRDGYLLGIGDLGWLAGRVIAEADGLGPHRMPQALFEDRQRQNRMVNAGWVVLRFTWADTLRPDYIPYVVRSALAGRLR